MSDQEHVARAAWLDAQHKAMEAYWAWERACEDLAIKTRRMNEAMRQS
jgi:hypothetical protein